jgi:hypothetical protein
MKQKGGAGTIIIVVAVGFLAYMYFTDPAFFSDPINHFQKGVGSQAAESQGTNATQPANAVPEGVTIAFWNIAPFSATSIDDLDDYLTVINQYDIVALQGIQDITGASWDVLCKRLDLLGYKCELGPREGLTTSPEQYGLVYRKGRLLMTARASAAIERPPTVFIIELDSATYNIVPASLRSDKVAEELVQLGFAANTLAKERPTIIGGNMYADCQFFTTPLKPFTNFMLLIPDSEDTTTGPTDCAFDRIFSYGLNPVASGTGSAKVTPHHPVWIEI